MFIDEVDLTVTDVAAAASFFTDVLELPTRPAGSAVEMAVGRTVVRLSPAREVPGVHHIAFDIPSSGFGAHRDWLAARVPLLRNAEGASEFEGPPGWNSRSLYFAGPDRMVLELIARRERPRPTIRVPELVSVSEVGIAVPEVSTAVTVVGDWLGADVLGAASDTFAPVGDHDGLLILVRTGRAWLPVFDEQAQPLPLRVQVSLGGEPAAGSRRTLPLTGLATVVAG